MHFKTCINRTACTEDGSHCRACGRSHEEIARVRAITTQVADFVQQMQYENVDEFLVYLSKKVLKKLNPNMKAQTNAIPSE